MGSGLQGAAGKMCSLHQVGCKPSIWDPRILKAGDGSEKVCRVLRPSRVWGTGPPRPRQVLVDHLGQPCGCQLGGLPMDFSHEVSILTVAISAIKNISLKSLFKCLPI